MTIDVEILDREAHWATWHVVGTAPRLIGASLIGPHGLESIARFFAVLDAELARGEDFHFLADNVSLRPGDHDLATFRATFAGARQRMPLVDRRMRRWATVSPSHAVGLAIAGSQRLLGAHYPARAFGCYEDAIGWLGYPAVAAELAAWLRALPAGDRERADLVARLRALVRSAGVRDLVDAAHRLGLGARTLQRTLAAHGTTFRRELGAARPASSRQPATPAPPHSGGSGPWPSPPIGSHVQCSQPSSSVSHATREPV